MSIRVLKVNSKFVGFRLRSTSPMCYSRQELVAAREAQDKAYLGVVKPYLYHIKDVHGDRTKTRDDKARYKENEEKIANQEARYAKLKNKVNIPLMEVDDALDARAVGILKSF